MGRPEALEFICRHVGDSVWPAEFSARFSTLRTNAIKHQRLSKVVCFGTSKLDNAFPEGGLRCGAIHEWCGDAPPLSIFGLLAATACSDEKTINKFIVWIGKDMWPTPYLANPIINKHSIFLDPPTGKLAFWAIEASLRSPAVASVIAKLGKVSFAQSRKLALAARHSGCLGLLFKPTTHSSERSSATSRWFIKPAPSPSDYPRFSLSLDTYKGAQPRERQWTLEIQNGKAHVCEIQEAAEVRDPCPTARRAV